MQRTALHAALFMTLASLAYALVNVTTQWLTQTEAVPPTAVAFYQYLFATAFILPWLIRHGRTSLKTRHLGWHIVRSILSAAGVQAFIAALAFIPVAQVTALVMTSPFFIVAGAGLLLKEKITSARLIATAVGFCGALIILEPWSVDFSVAALLPVIAAVCWAGVALITKHLARDERPETITVYLFIMLTPINAVWFGASGVMIPSTSSLWILLALGLVSAGSQYLLARAYAIADAAYLQPFDDLKLPMNIVLGWICFAFAPSGLFWVGTALIIAASLFIAGKEAKRQGKTAQALRTAFKKV